MFSINYRIVDDIDDIKNSTQIEFDNDFTDIFGFFAVNYNGIVEGYYHSNDLKEGETGQDMLISWFDLFLSVLESIKKSSYVAFREVGSLDVWYEFELVQDEVYISRAKGIVDTGNYIILKKQIEFDYHVWKNINISYEVFRNEILFKAKDFLNQIKLLNSTLLESNMLSKICNKMKRIESNERL